MRSVEGGSEQQVHASQGLTKLPAIGLEREMPTLLLD
jgi:hypothetical protein